MLRLTLALVIPLHALAIAADPSAADPFAPDAMRATISALASDAMLGRDTPSAQLDAAADLIAKRLAAAGPSKLEGLGEGGSFFVEYTLPAIELDSTALEVALLSA